jgi:deoxyribodipyrimidine photo-lyase
MDVRTAIALFTRDLRVHDNPMLHAAASEAEVIVPLFVLDDALLDTFGAANRVHFLHESLGDLRDALAKRGAPLVIRRGDTVTQTKRVANAVDADTVFVAEDVSAWAQRRAAGLREARLDVRTCPGITVVPPGELTPTSGDWFKVFTPYWRRWQTAPLRELAPTPRKLHPHPGVETGELPDPPKPASPDLPGGGEVAGRRRAHAWIRNHLADYEAAANDLAGDRTSRLSPYIHFGCISARELVELAGTEGESFVRQLCWRDFHHQLLAAEPRIAHEDQHEGRADWNDDPDGLAAWKEGETGVPLVDAGMKQLHAEGWMHNRARLVTGSYLTKTLGVDWREGARHFYEWLVDGDIANNSGNWQWVAGTGANPRPHRRLNPERQAKRFDPESEYIRRWLGDDAERLF